MADDERRAEIEAVRSVPREYPDLSHPDEAYVRLADVLAVFDRARDARGDDEAAVWRSMLDRIRIHGASGLWTGEDCAIGAVAALEGGDAGRAFMLEREAARSPQGEDHDARSFTICTRCWVVIGIDGENNLDRATTVCSHLGPFIQASPPRDGTVADHSECERLVWKMGEQIAKAEAKARDGTVAVEDVATLRAHADALASWVELLSEQVDSTPALIEVGRYRSWVAEFSPASTGDRENDEGRH